VFGATDLVDFLENLPGFAPATTAFFLAAVRFAAFMSIFPMFTLGNLRGRVLAGAAMAFGLPLAIMIYPDIEIKVPGDAIKYMALALKEALLGMALGALLALPLLAIQTVGDLVDQNRGASQSNTTDPINANETSVLGQSLMLIALLMFVSEGGLLLVLRGVYASHQLWPIIDFRPAVTWDAIGVVGKFVSDILRLGFILGTPFLLAFFALDIAFGLLGKLSQKLNVQEILPYLKNLVTVLLLPFYLLFLSTYLSPEWGKLVEIGRNFLGPR
jgi:type III secretion protein T